MESKHTLGPWKVIFCKSGAEVVDEHNRSVYNRSNPDEQKDNAYIMANSLELYKALKDILSLVEDDILIRNTNQDDNYHAFLKQGLRLLPTLKKCQQAIAKAEGKEVER